MGFYSVLKNKRFAWFSDQHKLMKPLSFSIVNKSGISTSYRCFARKNYIGESANVKKVVRSKSLKSVNIVMFLQDLATKELFSDGHLARSAAIYQLSQEAFMEKIEFRVQLDASGLRILVYARKNQMTGDKRIIALLAGFLVAAFLSVFNTAAGQKHSTISKEETCEFTKHGHPI